MKQNTIWSYIKADPFFADIMPDLLNYRKKVKGINTNGNPVDFTPEEKKKIKAKLIKIINEKNI